MTNSKALILALLASALGLQAGAAPVSATQAADAARAWVRRNGLAAKRSVEIERTSALKPSGDDLVYAVQLRKGGTVLVSGDTDREPVVAFTTSPVELTELSAGSPLAALLKRDAALRRRIASVAGGESVSSSHRRWTDLLDGAPASTPAQANGGYPAQTDELALDDVRVSPLLETRWGQEEMAIAGGEETAPCFNYFTPNGYVCGCVATALAQAMRYHCWPVAEVGVFTNVCSVDGMTMRLETLGGAYDWANMVTRELSADPGERIAQCEAIGRLTYECGVAVQMAYALDGSGAMTEDVTGALKNSFGYAQAVRSVDSTGLSYNEALRARLLYTSLDAGSPVILSIRGDSGGHAVVGDGYGFCTIDGTKIPYVHLNMGWTGENDWWYNLPEINCSDNPEDFAGFTIIAGATYAVFPDRTGRIVSGRVLDEDGLPVVGALVGLGPYAATTDERGVYAFVLSADDCTNGVYHVESANADRSRVGEVLLNLGDESSWGNDIRFAPPAVTLNGTDNFASLDLALIAASEGVVTGPQTFDISAPAAFTEAEWRIGYDAVFRGQDESSVVTRAFGGTLVAAEGAVLEFSNIAFAPAEGPSLRIEPGSRAVLKDSCDLGEIRVEAGGTLVLDTSLDGLHAFVVDTPGRDMEGGEICRYAGDVAAVAPEFVELLVCKTDESLAAEAVECGAGVMALVWKHVDSVREPAAAVSLTQGGATTHYRSLGGAFRAMAAGPAEILVRKDATLGLADALTVTDALTIRADEFALIGPADPSKTMAGAFTVAAGGSLTVSNVCFTGISVANPFVYVNGGEFVLEDAVLDSITSNHKTYGSPVTIDNGGLFAMRNGALVNGCSAVKGNGGAVRFFRSGCTMEVADSVIANCSAPAGYGGGVYVCGGSELRVSTGAWVCDNLARGAASDVYLAGNTALLTVTGPLLDARSIGVSGPAALLAEGTVFARVDAALDAHELETSARAFVNEGAQAFSAVADETGGAFAWSGSTLVHRPLDPADWDGPEAFAKVIYPDGTEEEWGSTQWAFESLLEADPDSEATVVLLQDDWFDEKIVVNGRVTLTSEPSAWFLEQVPGATSAVLLRAPGSDITVPSGAELTIENLMIGGRTDYGATYGSLIKVNGGSLTLGAWTYITDVRGSGSRAAGAVVVWNGGTFTMLPNVIIENCSNDYVNTVEGTGVGAGVLVDDGEAYLYGGLVTGCTAYKGAGVFIGNRANVHVKGGFCACLNTDFAGNQSNLFVSDLSDLVLEDPLDFSGYQTAYGIGYTEGARGDPVVFGRLSENYSGTLEYAAQDASCFVHDITRDLGVLVTNEVGALLMWSRGLAADGTYTDEAGRVYGRVDSGYEFPVAQPSPVSPAPVYNGEEQLGVPENAGYVISGNVGTNAGAYTAVATLKPGYVWSTGGSEPVEIQWTIGKAVYDMSGVTFADKTYMALGVKQSVFVTGRIPDGVSVAYEGNGQIEPGVYTVTAKFTGDDVNYEPIADMTAVMTISAGDEPDPPPGPEIVHPVPIAFRSIEKTGENEWTLVVTNIVPFCNYRLLSSTDLTATFAVAVDWTQAAADAPAAWTNVITTTDAARFWRAEAKDGEKPASN